MMIFASEDVGNADPRGLTLAVAAMQASEYVGMPEARIILAHAVTYLATAPKSNASYLAIEAAIGDVRTGRILPVPEHLKNRHVKAEGKAAPAAYKYPHDFEGHHVDQEYVPTSARYYRPGALGYEEVIGKRLKAWEAARGSPAEDA
jgi:putative ATPase